ncbi:MAG: hypothetical protein SF051_16220, partial [Elusimicrobiota bacterium]|nr:hypothetical protein [Elusimicrobiota bacterium]
MKRRTLDVLWLLHRPPEPGGTREQRAAWNALVAGAKAGCAPVVLAETPPAAWRELQAAYGGRGMELRPGWTASDEAFLSRLRAELRRRRFDAVVVSGAEAASRWLLRARMAAPEALIACHLPDPDALTAARAGEGPSAAAARREAARRALSQADEVWCDDARGLAAARALLRGLPAPAVTLTPVP